MSSSIQLGLLVLTSVLVLGCSERAQTQADMQQMLSKRLPFGTPKRQVSEYLDKKQIPHSDCVQAEGNCVRAKVSGGTQRLNVVRTDYGMTFRFDAKNKLIATEIKPYYTGP